jgi:hypothetical protein
MKKLLLTGLMTIAMIGCNSGGSGSGSGGGTGGYYGYSHEELASLFVGNLNLDPEFSVTMVKTNTLEYDYIVIYDPYTDSYDAIDIGAYDPSYDNAADYYFDNSGNSFFNLNIIDGHYDSDLVYEFVGYDYYGYEMYDYVQYDTWIPTRYADPYSTYIFEKTASTPKDLAKVAALKEVAVLAKTAKHLSSSFGLSLDRGKEIARLTAHWKKSSIKGMTNAEQDTFSTELLGFSITAGKAAAKQATEGNLTGVQELVDQAAKANGITPEHATKLMTKVFGL